MTVTVVIPVANDSRNRSLHALLAQLDRQSLQEFEVILVIGDKRQGRAINKGVSEACGQWIVTLDDDTQLIDDRLLDILVAAMESEPTIGLGGAACIIPESTTRFQRSAMQQIPRRLFPIQETNVDSDFVQHPCLIISRDFFREIGGEDEELIRGLDPVLRQKVRSAGRRVAVLADTAVVHLLPGRMAELGKMYYRNGRGSAFAEKFFPDRVVELTDGYDCGQFVEHRPLWYRLGRRIILFARDLLCGRTIRIVTDVAYACGWIAEYIGSRFPEDDAYCRYTEESVSHQCRYKLRRIRVSFPFSSTDEQIARLHISSDPAYVLFGQPGPELNFFRDKVGLFRTYAREGVLTEQDDQGQVLGVVMMLLAPAQFKRELIRNGYGVRYLISLFSGRYRGSPEGWKKWLRLPVAFVTGWRRTETTSCAKIVALIVREDMRGKGIGKRLLERAERLAIAYVRQSLEITVSKENEIARSLYEKFGFNTVGEVLESTGPSFLMRKSLPEAE